MIVNFFNLEDSDSSSGFTLIELLIVVAVLAILSGVILSFSRYFLVRGRDVQRESDLSIVRGALEKYYDDQQPKTFPDFSTGDIATDYLSLESELNSFLSSLPQDPRYPTSSYGYRVSSNGLCFELTALEEMSGGSFEFCGGYYRCLLTENFCPNSLIVVPSLTPVP